MVRALGEVGEILVGQIDELPLHILLGKLNEVPVSVTRDMSGLCTR